MNEINKNLKRRFNRHADMMATLSVVVAVYNGAHFLEKCLPAIAESADDATEIILVNDCSTDNSAPIGEHFGAKVITLNQKAGAANARNVGVRQAQGEIILFVDADVLVKADTIRNVRRAFAENSEYAAIFGSYDDAPGEPDFFSQYRNLVHHFFHQTGNREAETFWSGFGAIRRKAFLQIGGFDAEKFRVPAIEDIELGYRLREKGYRILLIPELQVKHLKKWTLKTIVMTDFWQRAVPWVELILSRRQVRHDLNLKQSQKMSVILTAIILLSITGIFWQKVFLIVAVCCLFLIVLINKDFYAFFHRCKGLGFTLLILPMHLLYFFYSGLAYAYGWFNVRIFGRTSVIR